MSYVSLCDDCDFDMSDCGGRPIYANEVGGYANDTAVVQCDMYTGDSDEDEEGDFII